MQVDLHPSANALSVHAVRCVGIVVLRSRPEKEESGRPRVRKGVILSRPVKDHDRQPYPLSEPVRLDLYIDGMIWGLIVRTLHI
jgi:hypothetical protein